MTTTTDNVVGAAAGPDDGLFPFGPLREADARFCPYCYAEPGITCTTQAHWPEVRPHHPIYLSGVHCAATAALEAAGADIGLMLQPGSHLHQAAPGYRWWAADNGCFAEHPRGTPLEPVDWFVWLAGLPDVGLRRRCLFATAPDVLGDAAATWRRSQPWLTRIRDIGIPAALVAQNGAEDHAATWDNDDQWDALFLGGDTAWKLSQDAHDIVREAHLRGKWVHAGRVNSWKRLSLLASWDLDSVDGTYLRFGPDTNGRHLARWLARLDNEPTLF